MSKSIYVAGGSVDARLVADYIERLKTAGFSITFDWTVEVLKATKPDHELSKEERQAIARIDLTAVRMASLFWVLLPKEVPCKHCGVPVPYNSIGCSIELGAALTYNSYSIVSGPHERSAMTSLATWSFMDHEEAYRYILDLAN